VRWCRSGGTRHAKRRNVLGVIERPLESRLRSKDSRAVRRGAVGKVSRLAVITRWPPTLRPSGSMSGEWKRGMARLVRHRPTKEPATDRPSLNNRATTRLYYTDLKLNCCIGCRPRSSAPRTTSPASTGWRVISSIRVMSYRSSNAKRFQPSSPGPRSAAGVLRSRSSSPRRKWDRPGSGSPVSPAPLQR
jgi:hypothetical protein